MIRVGPLGVGGERVVRRPTRFLAPGHREGYSTSISQSGSPPVAVVPVRARRNVHPSEDGDSGGQ
jgi:hypothetical protein